MKITFAMLSATPVPVGGFKVVFEYANQLSDRGHSVTVVLPALEDIRASFPIRVFNNIRYVVRGAFHRYGPERWFHLRPEVKLKWVPSLREANIPDGDSVIATGWPTAECVATYGPSKGRKFYLVQGYESWWGTEERVRATWKLPLHKIVIARWLQVIARSMGETCSYVPNGLDFAAFGCDALVRERRKPRVAMLYHSLELKGSADGVKALELARQSVPDLQATLFGVYPAPANLPPWVRYVRNPPRQELRAIYNQAAVFISPSWSEGWPLPPAEAMMSGAALLCTDIGGHHEYAVHEQNALIVPPRAPEQMAAALVRLLTDQPLRISLAENALQDISRFTWQAAVERFEAVLQKESTSAMALPG